jgi:outer membrane receptor protein involved in Fe transport
MYAMGAAGQRAAPQIQGLVLNARGAAVAGAEIHDSAGKLLAASAIDGTFSLAGRRARIEISAPHFVSASVVVQPGRPLRIILVRPLETVVVSAYRSPLASADSPASTRVLSREQLRQAATPALDGKLRQVPGFELFRRSSSLAANPTTEGVSLRGLGSTAASRSLVLFDDVPLNDPYGGWIHWEEIPEMAIRSVEVVRGGASDLYGSSAIGGVISLLPVRPEGTSLHLSASGGSESTTDDSLLGTVRAGRESALLAGQVIATDGYTLIAPDLRGPIDQPSNVHAQNGLIELDHRIRNDDRIFLRGSGLNEARHNGTPVQENGTRLWRYAAGGDLSRLLLRFYGDDEHYHQSFSSIAADRASEKLTRLVEDPADELGAAASWRQPVGSRALLLVGADTHDVRAADYEQLFTGAGGLLDTTARQRQTGIYAEALYTPAAWTLSASMRGDRFSNFDARQYATAAAPVALPSLRETVFDPRAGITRRLTPALALNASAFRAYRAPTENELYRTGQVGQQITLPNPDLRSERATGWEAGFQADMQRIGSSLRASYFWTQVNRPVTALTLSVTPTLETLKRANLGQIESRGVSLDYAAQAGWFAIEGGYQFARATVTEFAPQPALVGNWIPQVARNMATAQARATRRSWGTLSLQARLSGRQYDDAANMFLLHGYFRLDAYASHDLGRRCEIFASGENLFDRAIDIGRTPLLTLGTPRLARIGLRLNWGD